MVVINSIISIIIGVTLLVFVLKFYKFLILKCYKMVTRQKKKEETVNYNVQNLSLQHAIEYEKNSKNIKFHRTEKEEELSFQFSWNHGDEISTHVDSFEDCYALACEEDDLLKKIELLEKTIMRFEKAKKWFYRTKGGTIYFQDMYEHMHNSRNEDFSYIDLIKEDLDECTDQRDCVVAEILDLISSSSNGILQRDIYNIIPKEEIQGLIRELEHKGVIEKTKSGNSYLLTIKQPQ